MKISLNWLEKFTDLKLSRPDLIERIGSRLGEVDSVTYLKDKYKSVLVADIIDAKPHPNADKLGVYKIDYGKSKIQVVAGDRTLKIGDKIAYLPVGSVVPHSYSQEKEVVLEKAVLRGESSFGMLASAKELDFGESHAGVIKLDTKAEKGTLLHDAYELDDVIVELDNKSFTNRPDCFGIVGFAREVAGIQNIGFKEPEWLAKTSPASGSSLTKLKVKNEIPSLVSAYLLQAVNSVEVGDSPPLVASYLSRLGVRPINNIVDITNYMMLMTGQPLHVFDADKIKGGIVVRSAKKGEKLRLIDDNEVKFDGGEIVICDDSGPIAIGGIMGGASTEVSRQTKKIILESATFDMYSIRKTSMKFGIFSEAVTRFTRGQSPELANRVLPEAVNILLKTTKGEVGSPICGLSSSYKPAELTVDTTVVGNFLGREIEVDKASRLLENVGFKCNISSTKLKITVPFWRRDIAIEEDVAEEIARLAGYEKIMPTLPRKKLGASAIPKIQQLKSQIRKQLVAGGANELLTYSGISFQLAQKMGWAVGDLFKITNSRSPDLEYLRPALMGSLLEKVHLNHKLGHTTFALFEINPVHNKTAMVGKLPKEMLRLGFVFSSKEQLEGAVFYHAKHYLDYLFNQLGIEAVYQKLTSVSDSYLSAPFLKQRSAVVMVNKKAVGVIGEFTPNVVKNFKLPKQSAGFEVMLDELDSISVESVSFQSLSKYPAVIRDLTYEVVDSIDFAKLKLAIEEYINKKTELSYRLTARDIFRSEQGQRVTFRLEIHHRARTLTSQEANDSIEALTKHLQATIGAKQI